MTANPLAEYDLVRVSRYAMGSQFELFLSGHDPQFLRDAACQALDVVEWLETRISHYQSDSELCDLNQRGSREPVRLEPRFFRWLAACRDLAEETGGAFDPTCGALIRCWGFHRGAGRFPSDEEVAAALKLSGWRHLHLDPDSSSAWFDLDGVELNLGAVGKGLAIDLALQELRELGVTSALMHGGGSSVGAIGSAPDGEPWRVGLKDPDRPDHRIGWVSLQDRCLSTSGDYEQWFEQDGRRYSHLLDPRTGAPVQGVRAATVLGPSGFVTDALSTAIFILGVTGDFELISHCLARRNPQLAAVLVVQPVLGRTGVGPVTHCFGHTDYQAAANTAPHEQGEPSHE